MDLRLRGVHVGVCSEGDHRFLLDIVVHPDHQRTPSRRLLRSVDNRHAESGKQCRQVATLRFSGAGRVSAKAAVAGQQHGQPERRPERAVGAHPLPLFRGEPNRVDQCVRVEDPGEATRDVLEGDVKIWRSGPPRENV